MKLTSLFKKIVLSTILLATTTLWLSAQTYPFEMVPSAGGLPDLAGIGGAAWGDINNDGYPDVVMTGMKASESGYTQVFLNNGQGGFDTIKLSASRLSAGKVSFSPALPKLTTGMVSWIDYNRDGYLDLFVSGAPTPTGTTGNNPASWLYKNNGDSTFTVVANTGIAGFSLGMHKWADVDNDGLPDLVIAGAYNRITTSLFAGTSIYYSNSRDVCHSYIYKNNGNGTFEAHQIASYFHGDLAVFDMDNDGWNDILMQGRSDGSITALKNMGNMNFVYVANVASSGSNPGWRVSNYTNTGSFCIAVGDLDNDGFDDFVHLGGVQQPMQVFWNIYNDPADAALKDSLQFGVVYSNSITNLGANSFINFSHPYAISLGDYDNDGYLDILAQICYVRSGTGGSNGPGRNAPVSYETVIYRNKGNHQFERISMPSTFKGTSNGSVNFVDYDVDGKLDVFYFGPTNPLDGKFSTSGRTFLWRNILPKSPTIPNTVADGLNANQMWTNINGEDITFNWRRHSDPETSPTALRYNLRVGLSEGAGDRIMPPSDITRGTLTEGNIRNISQSSTIKGYKSDTVSVTLKGFKQGLYYWNVQAVDGSFGGSKWSEKDALANVTAMQAYDVRISEKTDTSFKVTWKKGSEKKSIVLLYTVSLPNYPASSGQSFPTLTENKFYIASDNQSESERKPISYDAGTSQWACVYNSNDVTNQELDSNTDTSCVVRGLQPGSQYCVAVISYSGEQGYEKYLKSESKTENPLVTGTLPDYSNKNTIAKLPQLHSSTVAWGDYNNDGYVDVVISGINEAGDTLTTLYKNTNGVFAPQTGVNLPGMVAGSLEWGDYNNDRYLDLLVTGYTSSKSIYGRTYVTRLYKNNGDGTFTEKVSGLPNVGYRPKGKPVTGSAAKFADFNNDGLLDVVISGKTDGDTIISRVYRNVGYPTYRYELMWGGPAYPYYNAMIAIADVNNDGFLDVAFAGDYNGAQNVGIYKNSGRGTFIDDNTYLSGQNPIRGGAFAFADVNHDGWVDLFVGGIQRVDLYKNVNGRFLSGSTISVPEFNASPAYSLSDGGAVLADYNNDGWVDIITAGLTGYGTSSATSSLRVLKNNGGTAEDAFTLQTSIALLSIKSGSISVADVDNDGIKDIYITGDVSSSSTVIDSCGLFNVGGVVAPSKPTVPTGLAAKESKNYVVMSWNGFKKGMTYNIMIDSAGLDKSYIPSDLSTGVSKTSAFRGVFQTPYAKITGLPAGTYKYRVQAIDTFGVASLWSDPFEFVVTNFQAKNIEFSNYKIEESNSSISNSVDVTWKNGSKNRRVVFAYEGSAAGSTLPVPVDSVVYSANSVYSNGTQVGPGWYCVYDGFGNSFSMNYINPTKVYSFVVYELSSDSLKYNTTVAQGNPTYTFMPPYANMSSGIVVSAVDTARKIFNVAWKVPSNGGLKRAVFVHTDETTGCIPLDKNTYLPKSAYNLGDLLCSDFENGQEIEGTGWRCVYNGNTTVADSVKVQVRDIPASNTFSIKVVEYNGIPGKELYNSKEVAGANPVYFKQFKGYTKPTKSACKISMSSVGSTTASYKFTKGNGVKRAVFMNADTMAVVPTSLALTDGVYYPANSSFGTASARVGSTGWYCVYNGNASGSSALTVTNLSAGVPYKMFISEYNGNWDFGNELYLLTDSSVAKNPRVFTSDYDYPTVQANDLKEIASTDSSLSLSWNSGNGSYSLLLARKASTGDITLSKDSTINASRVFATDSIKTDVGVNGWYAVYKGTGNACTVKGLLGDGTLYRFKVVTFNGANAKEKYLNSTGSNIITLSTDTVKIPTIQLSNLKFTSDTRRTDYVDISWDRGNGQKCIVFMKTGSSQAIVPVKNKTYSPSTLLSGTDWQCVYNGKSSSVRVNGLNESTSYSVVAMEYNGISTMEKYMAPGVLSLHTTHSKTLAPTIQISDIQTFRLSMFGAKLKWKRGTADGAPYRVAVFAVKGVWNSSKYLPVQGKVYSGDMSFGVGDTLVKDVYCIYNGLLDSCSITGLVANTTYSVKVFGYNCKTNGSSPFYNISDTTGNPLSFATKSTYSGAPAVQVSNLKVDNVGLTNFDVSWTRGDGSGRVVLIRKGYVASGDYSITSATNHIFTANTKFGAGETPDNNYYCVYYGNDKEKITVTGLAPNTIYTVVAYEYITDGAGVVTYRNSKNMEPGRNFVKRFTSPNKQCSNLSFKTQQEKLQLNWGSKGNGIGRCVFLHEGRVKSTDIPVQLDTFYTANATFGLGKQVGLSGWYCVYSGSNDLKVIITGLTSTKAYTAKIVEYNAVDRWINYYTKDTLTNPIDTVTYSYVPSTLSNAITHKITYDSINAYPTKVSLMWNKSDAQNYLLVVGPSDKVTVKNLNTYVADTIFDNGQSSITGSWFAMYSGPDTSTNVWGLKGETGYRALVFPYNGGVNSGNEVYLKSGVDVYNFMTDYMIPSVQASYLKFTNVDKENGTAMLSFNPGLRDKSYAKSVVFVTDQKRYGAPVLYHNRTYVASDSFGDSKASKLFGWQCVYNGSNDTVYLKGLDKNTEYHVMVCEYRGLPGYEKYNTLMDMDNPANITPLATSNPEVDTRVEGLRVYPNPVRDVLTISMGNNSGNCSYSLFNVDGVLIKSGKIQGTTLSINMTDYSSGIYLLRISTNEGIVVKQIMKL
jgi:hypothetical protein